MIETDCLMAPALESFLLKDDGLVPNNSTLPVRLYRSAFAPAGEEAAPVIADHFSGHGWGPQWIGGVFRYHHYHATAHEVLGVASGEAMLQLGGPEGPMVPVTNGDALLIPAGVGHKLIRGSADFAVVGAYPPGQESYDTKRATLANRTIALVEIPLVARPHRDPVLGGGPPWPLGR
jgi:uncharacterized protein YjlB